MGGNLLSVTTKVRNCSHIFAMKSLCWQIWLSNVRCNLFGSRYGSPCLFHLRSLYDHQTLKMVWVCVWSFVNSLGRSSYTCYHYCGTWYCSVTNPIGNIFLFELSRMRRTVLWYGLTFLLSILHALFDLNVNVSLPYSTYPVYPKAEYI